MIQSLPDAARGKPCMLRIPGVCNNDWSTVVLCHLREANIAGIAQKPNDLVAVFGCHACHDWIDNRTKHQEHVESQFVPDPTPDAAKLQALVRTLDYWHSNGRLFHNEYGELRWEAF